MARVVLPGAVLAMLAGLLWAASQPQIVTKDGKMELHVPTDQVCSIEERVNA